MADETTLAAQGNSSTSGDVGRIGQNVSHKPSPLPLQGVSPSSFRKSASPVPTSSSNTPVSAAVSSSTMSLSSSAANGGESDSEMPGENKEVRRAHHNALERKRRDHIKESFTSLRDQVPQLSGEKSSRAAILNSARDYINGLKNKNGEIETEVDSLRKENDVLLEQIRALERVMGQSAEPVFTSQSNIDSQFSGGVAKSNCDAKAP
eukprot:CFRG3035T1